ncbi:hypothetical protein [Microbispora bryophytorum]|uniref:Uncharacterized protein n=1 Tax=Microbispora bryophytorum TaxID=1460882 RepID=A0A8H9H2Z6_9ACTN|nr:hypothetical protein [Microbispora bryophytorum]GGO10333.1 hypothetical protein GCM10011574_26720 [Microbispora bryophytorum]
MTKYLISFPSAAMVLSNEELQAAADAAHAVVQEASTKAFRLSWWTGTGTGP